MDESADFGLPLCVIRWMRRIGTGVEISALEPHHCGSVGVSFGRIMGTMIGYLSSRPAVPEW